MNDEQLRKLERKALFGDQEAGRRVACYKIGKLQMELPINPHHLRMREPGRYLGQMVILKDGAHYPCFQWSAAWPFQGVKSEWIDVLTGEVRRVKNTMVSTMGTTMVSSRLSAISPFPNPFPVSNTTELLGGQ